MISKLSRAVTTGVEGQLVEVLACKYKGFAKATPLSVRMSVLCEWVGGNAAMSKVRLYDLPMKLQMNCGSTNPKLLFSFVLF